MTRKRGDPVMVCCPSCKEQRLVRKDYALTGQGYCRPCSAYLGGLAKKPTRLTGQEVSCIECSKLFWEFKHQINARKFCSKFLTG